MGRRKKEEWRRGKSWERMRGKLRRKEEIKDQIIGEIAKTAEKQKKKRKWPHN